MAANFHCLDWFQNLFTGNKIDSLIKEEFSQFKQDYHIHEIIHSPKTLYCVLILDQEGETIEEKYSEFDLIKNLLQTQLIIAKDCLSKGWIESTDKQSYLNLQFKSIEKTINNAEGQLRKFPELKNFILEIVDHLNLLSEDHSYQIKFPVNENRTNEKIILDVLSYLSGNNEKQEKIMSDEDFKILLKRTMYLVQNRKVLPGDKKLDLKITAELLRCTYWVLHKELFTTKKIKIEFLTFLHQNFPHFENSSVESIRSVFSRRNKIYPHEFIPPIIKEYLP